MDTTPTSGGRAVRRAATPDRRDDRMDASKLMSARDIYDADGYGASQTWASFQVRLTRLRNGWPQRRRKTPGNPYTTESVTEHPPELVETRDWLRVGSAVLYTPTGRRRIAQLLKEGK